MQQMLAGPLDGSAFVVAAASAASASEQENEVVDEVWVCYVCGTKNGSEVDDELEADQCTLCARLRYPRWLLLEQSNVQLQLGSHVRLLDDVNFGTKVAVVTGIGFFKRCIQVLSICSKFSRARRNEDNAQGDVSTSKERRDEFIFELRELKDAQIQQLQPASADEEAISFLLGILKQHGLCGDCRKVFRIAQGDMRHKDANLESIEAFERDLHKWKAVKAQSIKLKEHARALECTGRIKEMILQLSRLKRSIEFLQPLSCPHCGWKAS